MYFKMRYTRSYGHVYCTLFVASEEHQTYANCGKLTIRNDEFNEMRAAMSGVEFEEAEQHDLDGV